MEKYNIIVEKDSGGNYVASVQGMQGIYTQAKTYENVIKNIKKVISVWKGFYKNSNLDLKKIL